MYEKDKVLSEIAEKRLKAIREFTEFGSGFKIAMRDLEIRGAGNILGSQQHGHMAVIGYDLYVKMLNDAIKKVKGEPIVEEIDVEIDLSVNAYIPDTYIPDELSLIHISLSTEYSSCKYGSRCNIKTFRYGNGQFPYNFFFSWGCCTETSKKNMSVMQG